MRLQTYTGEPIPVVGSMRVVVEHNGQTPTLGAILAQVMPDGTPGYVTNLRFLDWDLYWPRPNPLEG